MCTLNHHTAQGGSVLPSKAASCLVTTWLVACGEMHKARRKFLGNFNFLNLVGKVAGSWPLVFLLVPAFHLWRLYPTAMEPNRGEQFTPHKKNVFTLFKLLGSNLIGVFILKQTKNCKKYIL